MDLNSLYVIFTGTDPESSLGGIGTVMQGYFETLKCAGLPFESIPTYHPKQFGGKWLLWLTSITRLIRAVRNMRSKGFLPVVYSHSGAGFSLFRESCLLHICRSFGARTVLHIHAPQVDSYLRHKAKSLLFRLALKPADIVIVLTPWWRNRLKAGGVRKQLQVIPNPLPPDIESIAKEEKGPSKDRRIRDSEPITILSMARLVTGKGVDVVVKAMENLPPRVQLIVAGDGSERSKLEKNAQKLGLENRIRFVGWISGDKKKGLLEKADLFCLPSTNDAFPMSFVEAMAYGLPVIGVKWGGIPDMVAHQKVGILVDAPEPSLVSDAIRKLLDDDVRIKMGLEAKRWVLEISSAKVVSTKMKEVLRSI